MCRKAPRQASAFGGAVFFFASFFCRAKERRITLTSPKPPFMTKKYLLPVIGLFLIIFITSCAPAEATTKEYGFLNGLGHGFVLFFVLIGKLFGNDAGIYAVNNSGFWYWLGYLIGLSILMSMVYGGGRRNR